MKKKIAMLLAATMVLSTSAFAAVSNDVTGDGEGDVAYVDATVYRVVVPTTVELNYVADPQGLASLEDGSSAALDTLEGGNVYSSSNVSVANRSSKDIVVTAKVKGTEVTAGQNDPTPVKLANLTDGLSTTTASVLLAVVPSEATFTVDTEGETYNKAAEGTATTAAADTDKYAVEVNQATTGYVVGTAEISIPVALKAAEYEVTYDTTDTTATSPYSYDIVDGSVGGAVDFAVAGKCSTVDTGWDGALPTLSVTFSFDEDTNSVLAEGAAMTVDTASLTDTIADLAVSAAANPVFTASDDFAAGSDFVITYTDGTEANALYATNPITSVVVVDNSTGGTTELVGKASWLSISDNTITIKAALTSYITTDSTIEITYLKADGKTTGKASIEITV